MPRWSCLTVFLVAAAAFPAAAVAAEATPSVMASQCTTCHGVGGVSPGTVPSISGMSAADIKAKLMAFRDGKGNATIMDRVVKAYTDAEIDALAHENLGLEMTDGAKGRISG